MTTKEKTKYHRITIVDGRCTTCGRRAYPRKNGTSVHADKEHQTMAERYPPDRPSFNKKAYLHSYYLAHREQHQKRASLVKVFGTSVGIPDELKEILWLRLRMNQAKRSRLTKLG